MKFLPKAGLEGDLKYGIAGFNVPKVFSEH